MPDQNARTAITPAPTELAAGITVRQDFGGSSLARSAETASTAVAAQVTAQIQARTVMAIQRPRDIDDVRVRILKECRRPGFAKVARYAKPIGGSTVQGPSIRFAECAIRLMGNLTIEKPNIYDDADKRIVRVTVTDLEVNASYSEDVTIEKTVERKQKKTGDVVVGERLNSKGEKVYVLRATEDDFAVKEAARVSKAIRTLGLRLLPGDILDDAMRECVATARNDVSADPEGERKRIFDAFSGIGINPSDLKDYLGKDAAQLNADDLVELRALFTSLKEGDTTWRAAMDARFGIGGPIEPPKRTSETQPPAVTPEVAAEPPAPAKKPDEVLPPSQNAALEQELLRGEEARPAARGRR